VSRKINQQAKASDESGTTITVDLCYETVVVKVKSTCRRICETLIQVAVWKSVISLDFHIFPNPA